MLQQLQTDACLLEGIDACFGMNMMREVSMVASRKVVERNDMEAPAGARKSIERVV